MSLILLINGILNILISGLCFFYTNKYRYLFSQVKLIVYATFSLYFLFVGFLRLRIASKLNQWFVPLTFEPVEIFNMTHIITCIVFIVFLIYGITFKGKIIRDDKKNF